MNTELDISFERLIKSCFISLLWAAASLTVTLYFKWDAVQLAKAFYTLTSYSLICIVIHFTFWQLLGRWGSKHKILDPNIYDSFGPPKLSAAPFEAFYSALFMIPAICALMLNSMLTALADRTNGWDTPADTNSQEWFYDVSLENWWLALLIVVFSTWKFIAEYRALKSGPADIYKLKDRTNVKLTFSAMGYALLILVISVFFNSHDQGYLYTLLIILFFLPWDAIFEIIMKIYDDYWKLD